MSTQQQLSNHIHLPGNEKGQVYLPLCAKPSFLAMLDEHPNLMKDTIQHCIDTIEKDILIFIADDAVMEEALMAVTTSGPRARRITSSVSAQIRNKVDDALTKLKNYPNSNRIKGVVHWKDIENTTKFQEVLSIMEDIMRMDLGDIKEKDPSVLVRIQYHVKALVKNLFTQRVNKARKAGSNISNVFIGDGFEMRSGTKYVKRYLHLERACLLELCMILTGLEYGGQVFTEMRYLTNDPRGMTYIAACLQSLRNNICSIAGESSTSYNMSLLKEEASVSHGITFVEITNEENSDKETGAAVVKAAYNADKVVGLITSKRVRNAGTATAA